MKFISNIRKFITTITPETAQDDYVAKSMGEFGFWQLIICLTVSTARLLAAWHTLAIVFLTPSTDFSCTEFEYEPPKIIKNSTCYENCLKYEYYNDVFEMTLISEFDLICNRAWLASFAQTVVMLGVCVGINIFGWISDRSGRRPALISCVATCIICSIAVPFSPDYWTFNCLRFFIGVGCGGCFTVTIVISTEVVGSKYREVGGGIGLLLDGVYYMLLSAVAYYTSTWNEFLLTLGSLSIVILVLMLFVPETPRWLIANRKSEEAIILMTRVAKFNNLSTLEIKDNVAKAIKALDDVKQPDLPKSTFITLFQTKELRINTIVSIAVWMITGLCFFGIMQYLTLLGSNIYIVVIIEGFAQIPGTVIGMILIRRFGRRIPIFCVHLMTGIIMATLIFLPEHSWVTITLGIIGLVLSGTVFSVIYVQGNELFPTVLRNIGFGYCSTGSKIGGMVAPFIANAKPVWISSLVFSVLPFIAAFLSLILPETKGRILKDITD